MKNNKTLTQHLLELLAGGHAHVDLKTALAGLPPKLRGKKPKGAEHTAWQLLEHIRIANWDILEFTRDAKHVSPQWPDGYWPKTPAPSSAAAWNTSIRKAQAAQKSMEKLVASKKTDLFEPIPHGTGQTVLREAMLMADHNAYHVGQLVMLRRLLGSWKH